MENKRINEIEKVIRNQDVIGLANYVVKYRIPELGMTEAKKIFRNKVLENRFLPTLLNLITKTYLSHGEINCFAVDIYVDNFIKLFINGESKNINNEAIMRSWNNISDKPVLGQPVENFAELQKWRVGQMNTSPAPTFEPPKPQPNDFICDTCEAKGDCDGDKEKVKFVGIIHHVKTDGSNYKPKLKIKDGVITKAWYDNIPEDISVVEFDIRKNFYNLINTTNSYKLVVKYNQSLGTGNPVPHVVTSDEFTKQRFDINFETFMNKLKTNPKFNTYEISSLELIVAIKPKQKRYIKK